MDAFMQQLLLLWPAAAGLLFFFLLGLWTWFDGEQAMEYSRKNLSWIRSYRRPGFPFRAQILPRCPARLLGLFAALIFALAVGLGQRMVASRLSCGDWFLELSSAYSLLCLAAGLAGAAALYVLLNSVFDSGFTALMGAMLFAASPVRGHALSALLALAMLLYYLYLRSERGLSAELWYLGGCAVYAAALGYRPQLLWLLPALVLLHWYKLHWLVRNNRLGLGALCGRLALGLGAWLVLLVLSWGACRSLREGDLMGVWTLLGDPLGLLRELFDSFAAAALRAPSVEALVPGLADAVLLGLGFWGMLSAIRLIRRRRSVRGWIALVPLVLLFVLWALCGVYQLTPALVLCFGCLLKSCELGRRKWLAGAVTALGILFSLALTLAAWELPLSELLSGAML